MVGVYIAIYNIEVLLKKKHSIKLEVQKDI